MGPQAQPRAEKLRKLRHDQPRLTKGAFLEHIGHDGGDPFTATPGPFGPFNIFEHRMMGYYPPPFLGAWVEAETRLTVVMLDAATEDAFDDAFDTAATLERLEAAHADAFEQW